MARPKDDRHVAHPPNEPSPSPSLGPIRRSTRALRSGLRRYPPELLASFGRKGLLTHAGSTHSAGEVRDLLAELAPHGLAVVWLGHASLLATLGPITIAVDPVLSHRIGPRFLGRTWGLSRRAPAPVAPSMLQGVDLVLLTHAHFDHLDRPTLEALASDRTTVVTPMRCANIVPRGFRKIVELAPGAIYSHNDLEVRALPTRHWGARVVLDRRRGSLGYALTHPEGSLVLAGDTAYTEEIARAAEAVGPVDLAAFGVGAYDPWDHMHATPEQVWRMFVGLGARFLLPIHHSTFELSDEPMGEPLERLLVAAGDDRSRVLDARLGEIAVLDRRD